MPKAKRKPAYGGTRRADVREHLVCGESDEDWEAALIMARSMVRDAIWDLCKDPTRRNLSHMQIIARVEEHVRSLIRIEERKSGERIVFRREFLEQPLAGVAALKRLGRPQASYAIAKAWKEMPAVAWDALNDASIELRGQPLRSVMNQWSNIPASFVQWDLAELTKLIPLAIGKAQSYGNRNSIRDQAIITILREFAVLRGNWPSAKEALRFIETIQRCYRELLPTYGFGIGSDAAIYRLLGRARELF